MAQAVVDGLILANPCLVKGASQRDSKDRTERRTATAQEVWALADGMPERYRASVIVAFCSGLRGGELFALQRRHVVLEARTARGAVAQPGGRRRGLVLFDQDESGPAGRGPAERGRRGARRAHGAVHRAGQGRTRVLHQDR